MQTLTFTLQPTTNAFEVPYSTGYQTYSGLLAVISEINKSLADKLHDTEYTSLSNSGILGDFGHHADRDYHKTIRAHPDAEYKLQLGIVHPDDEEIFEALVNAFVLKDKRLPLANGELTIEEVATTKTTHEELFNEAATEAPTANGVKITFQSPTCRQQYGDVWETTPHRTTLFPHLADRWNNTVNNNEHELTPVPEVLGEELYSKVHTNTYDTHSVVVHRNEPGHTDTDSDVETSSDSHVAADGGHLSQAQGFTGTYEFRFKNASDATRTLVTTLSKYAEYTGVGRHNARGTGSVTTQILTGDNTQ